MSGASDITRWNRAGLRRIRYVDANAATYLEELRVRLAERFPVWKALQRDEDAPESAAERNARLLAQYGAPRDPLPDWGWEIARVLARACHVLGDHVDAYANESYLGTATQYENLRRLAALVDYRPAPPASAFTHLALVATPDASGVLAPGFAVSAATPGSSVTFETSDALALNSALNNLRHEGFERSPEPLAGDSLVLEEAAPELSIGEPLLLESELDGVLSAHRIENIVLGTGTTSLRVAPALPAGRFVRGSTRIHARPKERLSPLGPTQASGSVGSEVVLARGSQGLVAGDVVTVADHLKRTFHRVSALRDARVTLDRAVGELRFDTASMGPTVTVPVLESRTSPANTFTLVVTGDLSRLPIATTPAGLPALQHIVADPRGFTGTAFPLRYSVTSAVYTTVTAAGTADSGKTVLRLEPLDLAIPANTPAPASLLIAATTAGPWSIDRPFVVAGRDPIVTTLPRNAKGGDLAVAQMGAQLAWGALASIALDEPGARATLQPALDWQRTAGELALGATTVFVQFAQRHRLVGWQINATPVSGAEVSLSLPASDGRTFVPAELAPGRKLVVARADAPEQTYLTSVVAIAGKRLRLRDPIPADAGFTRGNLRIAGNVVAASHGERQPEKVLGSGDATLASQTFVLAQSDVSFVPDATQPRGVRADVEVRVDGRIWEQVGTLRERGPTDSVYAVALSEDGALVVELGDGQNGRRAPTGRNNVRVRARSGVGLGGNVPAGTLTRIARPSPLVQEVEQPLPAVGGNDRETSDSLRRSAPRALLTLERCVAPEDFAALAASHASIWQARVFVRPSVGTRARRIEVVVVPANGAALGGLGETIAAFLRSHALPNVEVAVTRFRPLGIALSVVLEVDAAAYDPELVAAAVRAALRDALSLRRRTLGQPLFLSDVYGIVENVTGVSASRCVLNGDPVLDRILAAPDGVLFLDPATPGLLSVSHEAKR